MCQPNECQALKWWEKHLSQVLDYRNRYVELMEMSSGICISKQLDCLLDLILLWETLEGMRFLAGSTLLLSVKYCINSINIYEPKQLTHSNTKRCLLWFSVYGTWLQFTTVNENSSKMNKRWLGRWNRRFLAWISAADLLDSALIVPYEWMLKMIDEMWS